MIKKTSKLLLLAVATFFLAMVPTFAKQMSYEELEQTILEYEPDAESAYIIGKYVFTSAHTLKPQDYMLAAGTISATTADGKRNQDAIFGKMTIHFLDGEFNGDGETTGFAIQENKVGTTEITEDSTFNISYIDYQLLSEPTEFSVSVDIGDVFSDSDYYSSGNHSSLSLSPDGVLTGLIEKHANLDSWYPAETKSPGSYYFIYKLEVPGETEETVNKWGKESSRTC